jgi:Tfp pilus assembly protein PilF
MMNYSRFRTLALVRAFLTASRPLRIVRLREIAAADDASPPDRAVLLAVLGRDLMKEGAYEAAHDALTKARSLDPDNTYVQLLLAKTAIRTESYDEARACLAGVHSRRPRNKEVRHLLGWVLCKVGAYADAVAMLRTLENSRRARRDDFILDYGFCLQMSGDSAGAERQYRKGLQADPQSSTLNLELGRLLLASGKATEAAEHLGLAILHSPDSSAAWPEFVKAVRQDSLYRKVTDVGEAVLRKNPRDEGALLFSALAHLELGNYVNAEQLATELCQYHPDNPRSQSFLEFVRTARSE